MIMKTKSIVRFVISVISWGLTACVVNTALGQSTSEKSEVVKLQMQIERVEQMLIMAQQHCFELSQDVNYLTSALGGLPVRDNKKVNHGQIVTHLQSKVMLPEGLNGLALFLVNLDNNRKVESIELMKSISIDASITSKVLKELNLFFKDENIAFYEDVEHSFVVPLKIENGAFP